MMKINLFRQSLAIPIAAVILFMVVWMAFGAMIGVFWDRSAFYERAALVAREKKDVEDTFSFLQRTKLFNPTDFINPEEKEIQELARSLKTPEAIYVWLSTNIKYDPQKGFPSDSSTLAQKESSCYGMAALAVSMLRAAGFEKRDTHVTIAELEGKTGPPHAWASFRRHNRWYVLDATTYASNKFPNRPMIITKEEYLSAFPSKNIIIRYNDTELVYDLIE